MSTVVLLGAGASRPAGIPMARPMLERLVAAAPEDVPLTDERERPSFRKLAGEVRKALEAHAGPEDGVEIERFLDGLRALHAREQWAGAAFVDKWHPLMEQVEAFNLGVQASRAVVQMATVPAGADLSYLDALWDAFAAQGELTIATLNYDRCVERSAQRRGQDIDTGIHAWWKRRALDLRPHVPHLLKLHGSIDWVWTSIGGEQLGGGTREVQHIDDFDCGDPWGPGERAIVLGGENKLRADGPYLDLLREFEQSLAKADRLVVVGYSFRDAHINTKIHKAVFHTGKTFIVIDPIHDHYFARVQDLVNMYKPPYWLKGSIEKLLPVAMTGDTSDLEAARFELNPGTI